MSYNHDYSPAFHAGDAPDGFDGAFLGAPVEQAFGGGHSLNLSPGMDNWERPILLKALRAQEQVTDVTQLRGMGPLMVQSLEMTAASITFDERHLTLYRDVQPSIHQAYSTVEEYSIESGYGIEAAFTEQMESPPEDDPEWIRQVTFMAYIRTLWKVSAIAKLVRTMLPVEQAARRAAVMRMMRTLELALYEGDRDLIPQSIDGWGPIVRKLNGPENRIDMRGETPTKRTFEDIAQLLFEQFAAGQIRLYCSAGGVMTLNNIYNNVSAADTIFRIIQGQSSPGPVDVGHALGSIKTPLGNILWRPDLFVSTLNEAAYVPHVLSKTLPVQTVEGPTSARAPAKPSAAAAIDAPTVTGSKWAATGYRKGDGTVRYKYRVCSRNRWGRSVATAEIDPGGDVTAGGSITVTITPQAGTFTADSFEVFSYAAPADVTTHGLFRAYTKIGEVAANGMTPVTFVDLNHRIPRTTTLYIGDNAATGPRRTMAIARLLPIFNQDLALVGPYTHGLATYALAMKYYAPQRMALVENVPINVVTTSDRLLV